MPGGPGGRGSSAALGLPCAKSGLLAALYCSVGSKNPSHSVLTKKRFDSTPGGEYTWDMETKCLRCNKKFNRPPSREKDGKGKYCSRGCAHLARTKECVCLSCGKKWRNPTSQKGDKYCSRKCYITAKGISDCVCVFCGKIFHPNQRTKPNKFCSHKCHSESRRISPEDFKRHRLEYTRKYRKENPEWVQALKSKYRAKDIGAPGQFTANDFISIKRKQGFRCAMCGQKKKLSVDHIIPLSRGGSNFPENIQALCISCNVSKFDGAPTIGVNRTYPASSRSGQTRPTLDEQASSPVAAPRASRLGDRMSPSR